MTTGASAAQGVERNWGTRPEFPPDLCRHEWSTPSVTRENCSRGGRRRACWNRCRLPSPLIPPARPPRRPKRQQRSQPVLRLPPIRRNRSQPTLCRSLIWRQFAADVVGNGANGRTSGRWHRRPFLPDGPIGRPLPGTSPLTRESGCSLAVRPLWSGVISADRPLTRPQAGCSPPLGRCCCSSAW